MIKAVFKKCNGALCSFDLSGHSLLDQSGRDILCAAVSSMAALTVNAVTGQFGADASVSVDDKKAQIIFKLNKPDENGEKMLYAFRAELAALERLYPDNIRVTTLKSE